MGLTSRDGVIPLYLRNDIAGPMARTVEDAVRLFEVVVVLVPLLDRRQHRAAARAEGAGGAVGVVIAAGLGLLVVDLAILGLLALKLGYEGAFGPVPFSGEVAAGPVVTPAHAWGAAGGALAALALLAIRRRRPSL